MMSKTKSTRIKQTRIDTIFDICNHILIGIIVFICVYPLYYTVIASFSDPMEVYTGGVTFYIKGFTTESYENVLRFSSLWKGYRNTIFYTFVGTAYNMLLLLPASYALSRRELKGRGFFMAYFVFTMYFGGGMIPAYLNIRDLNLLDSWWVLIINGAFSVYNMIITRTYYASNFPNELAEAARIDGAGEMRIFFQLALPLSSAIIAVMVLYHAVGHWNSWFSAMIYINDMDKYPLQLVLRQVLLQNSAISLDQSVMQDAEAMMDMMRRQRMAETMKYSVIFIANAPVLALYPFVQKYFTKGVMVGSVKG